MRSINWLPIALFYGLILAGTYFARKLPNLLQLILERFTDIPLSFNYNHGLVTLLAAFLFYQFSGVKKEISLLGNKPLKSLLFPLILFTCYISYGMNNQFGINTHVWAFIFCCLVLLYNIMEEYAWRGYLIESLGRLGYVFKALTSGVLWSIWHLLVFNNFNQYGGFWIFFAFCIIFSFILTFAVQRTKSIIVAASIHAFIIQTNVVAIICFVLFMLLLLTWNKKIYRQTNNS